VAPPPRSHEDFFKELVARVPTDQVVDLIHAFGECAEFDEYNFRKFLEQIPGSWRERLAVRTALRDLVQKGCTRFCFNITKFRYYQALPLSLMSDVSGIAEGELIRIVLASLGKTTESMGSGRLFTMVGLLAPLLTNDEGLEALSFGLGLFETTLTELDGDGPWSKELEPPADMDQSIAGYRDVSTLDEEQGCFPYLECLESRARSEPYGLQEPRCVPENTVQVHT
jgi:hypothetical protein